VTHIGGGIGSESGTIVGGTPIIYNLSMASANTEYSQAIDYATKAIYVKMRVFADSKIAFTNGESGTNYLTIESGGFLFKEGIDLINKTIYIQSNASNQIAEIIVWT
jgi:hypothetical protein